MEKQINQENPHLFPNKNIIPKEESPKKAIGCGGNDRLKRDEWSEGAVSSLLDAYESKWVLRNRAKLKGHDWEDVARQVSARANFSKSSKTQTQCKNKIESMKKRYRSESATADGSTWPLYQRLDLLLRGSSSSGPQPPLPAAPSQAEQPPPTPTSAPLMLLEESPVAQPPPPPPAALPAPPPTGIAQNSHGSNGVDRTTKEDEAAGDKKASDHQIAMETDSSTPALYSEKFDKLRSEKWKTKADQKRKRKRKEEGEIADSIRWLAEAVLKAEEARMETMREIERMRVEAEAKRSEMELKRTEIIANTQLEIARIFAAANGKSVDSSLRIGRS